MSMIEKFCSVVYKGRDDLFENLSIWKDEDYRKLQGTYPVISLSLASVKESNFQDAYNQICQLLSDLYNHYAFLKRSGLLEDGEFDFFERVQCNMGKTEAVLSLHHLSDYMSRYYGKKVIILLNEYDTPMQEAWVNGYWIRLKEWSEAGLSL